MDVLSAAQPFRSRAGRTGVLLCHGFTGSPVSMRPWADHLAAAGLSVELPRLPGHGTSWQELNRTHWTDWYAAVERALFALAEDCDTIVVAGLSMGGCLSLRLAQQHPELVRGLVLVNPAVAQSDPRLLALPVLRFLRPSVKGISNDIAKPGQDEGAYERTPLHALHSQLAMWRQVRADLASVTQPILLLHSAVDHVVDDTSVRVITEGVASDDVTVVALPDSYHVATLDHDAPTIFARSVEFVGRVTASQPDGDRPDLR